MSVDKGAVQLPGDVTTSVPSSMPVPVRCSGYADSVHVLVAGPPPFRARRTHLFIRESRVSANLCEVGGRVVSAEVFSKPSTRTLRTAARQHQTLHCAVHWAASTAPKHVRHGTRTQHCTAPCSSLACSRAREELEQGQCGEQNVKQSRRAVGTAARRGCGKHTRWAGYPIALEDGGG